MGTLRDNNPIEIAKFAMCGLCFFVHVVEYIIAVGKTFIVVSKTITLSSIDDVIKLDDIVHFSSTLSMKLYYL